MSEYGPDVYRDQVDSFDFCPCESAYCTQHGGHLANEDYAYPGCNPCPNKPEGNFTMDWLGAVCDECAAVAVAKGMGHSIHRIVLSPTAQLESRLNNLSQSASDVSLSWNERRIIYWALRHVGEFELGDRFCEMGDDDDHGDDLAAKWGVRL